MTESSRFFRRIAVLTALAAPGMVAMGQGCTIGKEICDLRCECTQCSDRAFDECVIGENAAVDTADAYDCRTEYDAVVECYIDNFDCDEGDNEIKGPDADDCADEQEDYGECVADASDLDGATAGPGPSQQASTAESTSTSTASSSATGAGGATGISCCDCTCVDAACGTVQTGCLDPCDCTTTCEQVCVACMGVASATQVTCGG